MMSSLPIDLSKVPAKNIDREILRAALIAELDAVNLYDQFASMAKSDRIKATLADIAKEEKTHIGEFQALLLELDKEQVEELAHGKKEVSEL
ncbi:MAG: ferritin family protein [Patescibacteria group bacterium]|nr:ferritin family protein [Patescibacteria group bacterium]